MEAVPDMEVEILVSGNTRHIKEDDPGVVLTTTLGFLKQQYIKNRIHSFKQANNRGEAPLLQNTWWIFRRRRALAPINRNRGDGAVPTLGLTWQHLVIAVGVY